MPFALACVLAACNQRFDDDSVEALAGFPVPASAEQTVDRPRGEAFRVLASKDRVAEWYERQLPPGRDFRNWQWCRYQPGQIESYTFHDSSRRNILDLTLTGELGQTGISINIAPLMAKDLENCA